MIVRSRPRVAAALIGLLWGLLAVPAETAAADPTLSDTESSGLLVRWQPDTPDDERRRLLVAHGLTSGGGLPLPDTELVLPDSGSVPAGLAESLTSSPHVLLAEPDPVVQATGRDPAYNLLWGLHNTGQAVQGVHGVSGIDVDAPEAWAVLPSDAATVTVAVLDTGVDVSHPDLVGALWSNPGEVPGNGRDDDRNGKVDDVHGWDFVHNDRTVFDPADGEQHGTHVAGTLAAVRDNGIGIAGTAPNVQIMVLKVLDSNGGGSGSSVVNALAYARQMGARVANLSLSTTGNSSILRDALARSGIVVAAAAGNSGKNVSIAPEYPAAYDLPNIVSVAAVDNRGARPAFSNYGGSVDLGAPGVRIASTGPGNQYVWMTGTSMAAPHVAGVAAMVAGVLPAASATEVAALLTSTVTPLPSLAGATTSGGMLNAEAAVTRALGARSTALACPERQPMPFSDVPLGGTHAPSIACAAAWSLVRGTGGGTLYAPDRMVTRAQMAGFMVRLLREAGVGLDASHDAFDDDAGNTFEADINALAAVGVVRGTAPRQYSPSATVSRAQMATFLVRAVELAAGPLPAGRNAFSDDDGSPHEESIDKAAAAGLVRGMTGTTYSPDGTVTRAQMASFLVRALDRLVVAEVLSPRP
jgi:hypothetical protein